MNHPNRFLRAPAVANFEDTLWARVKWGTYALIVWAGILIGGLAVVVLGAIAGSLGFLLIRVVVELIAALVL
jgi:hypothetical protein